MPTFKDARTGAAISVKVIPRAKKNEVAGLMEDGTIRIRLTAPPVEGAANEAVAAVLAEALGVPARAVHIAAGQSGRQKLVDVDGVDAAGAMARLLPT